MSCGVPTRSRWLLTALFTSCGSCTSSARTRRSDADRCGAQLRTHLATFVRHGFPRWRSIAVTPSGCFRNTRRDRNRLLTCAAQLQRYRAARERLLLVLDRISQRTDALDLDFAHVAGFHVQLGIAKEPDAGGGAGDDHVAGLESHRLAQPGDQRRHIEN